MQWCKYNIPVKSYLYMYPVVKKNKRIQAAFITCILRRTESIFFNFVLCGVSKDGNNVQYTYTQLNYESAVVNVFQKI